MLTFTVALSVVLAPLTMTRTVTCGVYETALSLLTLIQTARKSLLLAPLRPTALADLSTSGGARSSWLTCPAWSTNTASQALMTTRQNGYGPDGLAGNAGCWLHAR